jgi:hypothetical protein
MRRMCSYTQFSNMLHKHNCRNLCHVYIVILSLILTGCDSSYGYKKDLSLQIQWQKVEVVHPVESEVRFKHVMWDGKFFLLVGEYGLFMRSVDGVAWESVVHNLDRWLENLSYGNGVYLATTEYYIYKSTDTECWSKVDFDYQRMSNVIWTGRHFVIASKDASYSSIDGEKWKKYSKQPFEEIPELSWSGSQIIARTDNGYWISPDGVEWRQILQNSHIVSPIHWQGKLYGISATNPWIFVEQNGKWQLVLKPKKNGFFGITNGFAATDKHLFAFGDHLSWSTDGVSWGSIVPMHEESCVWLRALVYGNNRYITIGDSGLIMVGVAQENLPALQQAISENKKAMRKLKNKNKLAENATPKQRIDFYNFPQGFYQDKTNSSSDPVRKTDIKKSIDKTMLKKIEAQPIDVALTNILNILNVKNKKFDTYLIEIRKEYPDFSKMDLIKLVLEKTGNLFWFDAESGTYPVPYDWLISGYSELATQQGIKITKISMRLATLPCGGRKQYQVRWRLNGNIYGIDFYDDSDWFSYSVIQALNTSLYLHGYQQRFVGLDTGDQTAQFILADPDVVAALGFL